MNCPFSAIICPVFSVTHLLAILIAIVRLFKIWAKIKKAVADPVRLEMDILGEQLEEIQERKLRTSQVEDIGDNQKL